MSDPARQQHTQNVRYFFTAYEHDKKNQNKGIRIRSI